MSEIILTSSGIGKLVQQECHQNTNHLILPKNCLGLTLGTQHTFNGLLRLKVSICGVSGLSTCLRLFLVSCSLMNLSLEFHSERLRFSSASAAVIGHL